MSLTPEEIAKKHFYKSRAYRERNGGYMGCAIRAITEAIEAEREECAKVADCLVRENTIQDSIGATESGAAKAIAGGIRLRGSE